MFADIVMINYQRPLAERARSRKLCGPYHWTPAKPGTGRGFYQASRGLEMDCAGSTFALRLTLANDVLSEAGSHSRMQNINGYYCDAFQDQTLVPIVARLPSGRGFLAGWTMGAGMLGALDSTVWDDASEAARAAHDFADSEAEDMREAEESEEGESDDNA